jgi:deoxycytidylate deaminase
LYVTREPCYACDKLIQAAGVHAVVWPDPKEVGNE